MAAPKKTVKPVAKAAETVKTETVKPIAAKTEAVKAETAAPMAEAKSSVAAEAPKTEAKKETASKPGRKPKTEVAKKLVAKKTVKKSDQKNIIHVQFSGKSYSQEELVKMAQDVWKYDLKQKVRELVSVELYVKPEENKVYYVMNQQFTGDFNI